MKDFFALERAFDTSHAATGTHQTRHIKNGSMYLLLFSQTRKNKKPPIRYISDITDTAVTLLRFPNKQISAKARHSR